MVRTAVRHRAAPSFVIALLILAAGVIARIWSFDLPARFTFDEHHFVENARNYLAGTTDWNDHPPLGKLLIAACMALVGDQPSAWRLPSLIGGLCTVGVGGWLAARAFRSRFTGLLAATLIAADGFLLTYSRTALLDGNLAFFSLSAACVALGRPHVVRFVAAGVFAGLAASMKMSGIAALGPVLLTATLAPNARRLALALAALIPFTAVYVGQWMIGLALTGQVATPIQAVEETFRLVRHHAAMTAMTSPLTSSWPTWLGPTNPITLFQRDTADGTRIVTSLGNPLLWWTTSLFALTSLGALVWFGARATVTGRIEGRRGDFARYWRSCGRGSVIALGGWLAFLLPWMLSRRDPYIYHYLPAYVFGLVLVAGALGYVHERRPMTAQIFLCAVMAVFAFYLPVWEGLPLRSGGVEARLFFGAWR